MNTRFLRRSALGATAAGVTLALLVGCAPPPPASRLDEFGREGERLVDELTAQMTSESVEHVTETNLGEALIFDPARQPAWVTTTVSIRFADAAGVEAATDAISMRLRDEGWVRTPVGDTGGGVFTTVYYSHDVEDPSTDDERWAIEVFQAIDPGAETLDLLVHSPLTVRGSSPP